MKRAIALVLTLTLTMVSYGCAPDTAQKVSDDKLQIISTIFPSYDWVRQILGARADTADLTYLLGSGIDLHSFQPSVADIARISGCDLFLYAGGTSDAWVSDVLKEATNPNMVVINLLESLGDGAVAEELVEGMGDDGHDHEAAAEDHNHKADDHEAEETRIDEHGHEESQTDEHDHEEAQVDEHDHEEDAQTDEHDREVEPTLDEHVWLSLKNAEIYAALIAEALSVLDADHAPLYRQNLDTYVEKLQALDAEYQTATDAAAGGTLLFGDRFPFRYLTDDYGLTYFAAFPGCSAETEASFETIAFLANKTSALGLDTVLVTESADQSIANTVIANTAAKNQRILVMDAMQSVTAEDVENGATYLSIMEQNLQILKDAL